MIRLHLQKTFPLFFIVILACFTTLCGSPGSNSTRLLFERSAHTIALNDFGELYRAAFSTPQAFVAVADSKKGLFFKLSLLPKDHFLAILKPKFGIIQADLLRGDYAAAQKKIKKLKVSDVLKVSNNVYVAKARIHAGWAKGLVKKLGEDRKAILDMIGNERVTKTVDFIAVPLDKMLDTIDIAEKHSFTGRTGLEGVNLVGVASRYSKNSGLFEKKTSFDKDLIESIRYLGSGVFDANGEAKFDEKGIAKVLTSEKASLKEKYPAREADLDLFFDSVHKMPASSSGTFNAEVFLKNAREGIAAMESPTLNAEAEGLASYFKIFGGAQDASISDIALIPEARVMDMLPEYLDEATEHKILSGWFDLRPATYANLTSPDYIKSYILNINDPFFWKILQRFGAQRFSEEYGKAISSVYDSLGQIPAERATAIMNEMFPPGLFEWEFITGDDHAASLGDVRKAMIHKLNPKTGKRVKSYKRAIKLQREAAENIGPILKKHRMLSDKAYSWATHESNALRYLNRKFYRASAEQIGSNGKKAGRLSVWVSNAFNNSKLIPYEVKDTAKSIAVTGDVAASMLKLFVRSNLSAYIDMVESETDFVLEKRNIKRMQKTLASGNIETVQLGPIPGMKESKRGIVMGDVDFTSFDEILTKIKTGKLPKSELDKFLDLFYETRQNLLSSAAAGEFHRDYTIGNLGFPVNAEGKLKKVVVFDGASLKKLAYEDIKQMVQFVVGLIFQNEELITNSLIDNLEGEQELKEGIKKLARATADDVVTLLAHGVDPEYLVKQYESLKLAELEDLGALTAAEKLERLKSLEKVSDRAHLNQAIELLEQIVQIELPMTIKVERLSKSLTDLASFIAEHDQIKLPAIMSDLLLAFEKQATNEKFIKQALSTPAASIAYGEVKVQRFTEQLLNITRAYSKAILTLNNFVKKPTLHEFWSILSNSVKTTYKNRKSIFSITSALLFRSIDFGRALTSIDWGDVIPNSPLGKNIKSMTAADGVDLDLLGKQGLKFKKKAAKIGFVGTLVIMPVVIVGVFHEAWFPSDDATMKKNMETNQKILQESLEGLTSGSDIVITE